MNNTTWLFDVYHPKEGEVLRPLDASKSIVLRDQHIFGTLYSLLNRFLRPGFSSERVHSIAIDESATELQQALSILADAGLKPVFQYIVTPEQRGKFFPVRRTRPPFSLSSSNWLRVMCMQANRGGEILSLDDGKLVAGATENEARRKGHCLDLTFRAFAVTEEFKTAFEDAGLVGAVFRPLAYLPVAPNCKRRYWMDTNVTAPWCPWSRRIQQLDCTEDLIGTVIGQTNETLVGHTGGVGFDDEGHDGPGIAYRRADMIPFEGIDFMQMAEWTVEHRGVWRSEHIVSQRFRAWAKKFGCRFIMTGVKLLD